MNTASAIRAMCENSGKSQRSVAVEMGRSSGFVTSALAKTKDLKVATMTDIADVCGYTLCLVPNRYVSKHAIVIDRKQEEQRKDNA